MFKVNILSTEPETLEVSETSLPKSNFYATESPSKTNDATEGFEQNSIWIDRSQSPPVIYRCLDNTRNNAKWIKVDVSFKMDDLEGWFQERFNYFIEGEIDSQLSGGSGIIYNSGTISVDTSVIRTFSSDVSTSDWVLDEDDLYSNDNTKVPTQQSVRAYIDNSVSIYTDDDAKQAVGNIMEGGTDVSVTFDYTDDIISVNLTGLTQFSTDDLSEGSSSLYFTTSRIDNHLSGGTGINYSTGTISTDDANIDHDSLNNFVSTEHIDHTNVSISSGTGLSGGGDISASRTLSLDAVLDNINDVSASSPSDGQVLTYNSTSGDWEAQDASGGGSSLPQLIPDNMSLDDTDTNSSRGTAFSMIETIDFGSGSDGAVWVTFHFPSSLDDSKDINLDIVYNLSGSDDSTTVTMQTEYWVIGEGTTPDPATPTGTNSDDIGTGTGEDGSRRSYSLTNIPSGDLTAGNTITFKFTRLGSSDTYSGTFQMLYVFPYQA